MGQRDEEAAAAALAMAPDGPGYLGVVASRARAAEIRQALAARGASEAALARIKSPAGLDLGARTPEEIALSILAEIVQVRRAAEAAEGAATAAGAGADVAPAGAAAPSVAAQPRQERDPVCGMTVTVKAATPRAEHDGHSYYFCCGSCRERFVSDPLLYAAAAAAEDPVATGAPGDRSAG